MNESMSDIFKDLLYFSLFNTAENARWKITEIPWEMIDTKKVDDKLIALVRQIIFGELTTYSATRSFMEMFSDDIDFTQWLSVWLYEETKHPHVLIKWLNMVGESIDSSFIHNGRSINPMTTSKVEMLTFNIISEIVAANLYVRASKTIEEKVLKSILLFLAKDEMRHSVGFERYTRLLISRAKNPDQERISCLRSAWAFLNSNGLIQHPVFMAAGNTGLMSNDVEKKIRKQVSIRIGSVVGLDIKSPREISDHYFKLKKNNKIIRLSPKSRINQ